MFLHCIKIIQFESGCLSEFRFVKYDNLILVVSINKNTADKTYYK